MIGFATSGAECCHAFHGLWGQAVELYQTSVDVFAGLLPILHGILTGIGRSVNIKRSKTQLNATIQ